MLSNNFIKLAIEIYAVNIFNLNLNLSHILENITMSKQLLKLIKNICLYMLKYILFKHIHTICI